MPNRGPNAVLQPKPPRVAARIGCVSFLNAVPLVDGLGGDGEHDVSFDVPSRLLAQLEDGRVDVALCPVIDFHLSRVPLCVVPAGGIASEGETLTVRLFSRVPPKDVRTVLADGDSHTSVVLLQVLLAQQYGVRPRVDRLRAGPAMGAVPEDCDAMMLIGDKVVTCPPPAAQLPHQVDLGKAWHELTGLPFVFAVWMCRRGADLGDLPATLVSVRQRNADRLEHLAAQHAPAHGWSVALARKYLCEHLQFEVGPRHVAAMDRFAQMAAELGLIERARPLRTATKRRSDPDEIGTGSATKGES